MGVDNEGRGSKRPHHHNNLLEKFIQTYIIAGKDVKLIDYGLLERIGTRSIT